jgi:hypothetical protein
VSTIFLVTLTCVWIGSGKPSCDELHQPVSEMETCKTVSNMLLKTDAKPARAFGEEIHIRTVKAYCQLEHDGPSYDIDLRTGQISVR